MSKILLILSAVLLLGSSALSFVNKGKLTASLEDAKGAHADALAAHQDATKTHTALKTTQNDLVTANQKVSDTTMQLTSAQGQVTDLTGQLKTSQDSVAGLNKQLQDLNDKLNKFNTNPTSGAADPTEIAKKIDDLTKQRDELQVVKDGLATQLESSQKQLAFITKQNNDRKNGILMQGLQGRVLAVDRNWNFVVINLGDQKGVINNATMIVQRGGELVGKVRITSVEPSQSIADIIPNSVPPGVTVQAGDTVVFPGT